MASSADYHAAYQCVIAARAPMTMHPIIAMAMVTAMVTAMNDDNDGDDGNDSDSDPASSVACVALTIIVVHNYRPRRSGIGRVIFGRMALSRKVSPIH